MIFLLVSQGDDEFYGPGKGSKRVPIEEAYPDASEQYVPLCLCINVYVLLCLCINVYVLLFLCINVYVLLFLYINVYVLLCPCINVYVLPCPCINVYVLLCLCINVYVPIQITAPDVCIPITRSLLVVPVQSTFFSYCSEKGMLVHFFQLLAALEYNMFLYQQQQNTLDLIVDLCGEVRTMPILVLEQQAFILYA